MFINRILEDDIKEGARYFPVIAILGPRQSGKTTLAQKMFSNHRYVSLEEPDQRNAALTDPRSFLQIHQNEFGLIIDEFQYAPELLSYIQTMVDKEQKQGFFILTGSQNFLMNQAITQSLAGRVSLHTLLPLSAQELQASSIMPQEIEDLLIQGSYPAIYTRNIPPARLYAQYIKTYIERDVRQLAHVGDLATFQLFLTMCAERIGQRINLSEFSRECRISDQTVKRWMTILQASYIIFLLQPYEKTLSKRMVKTAKLFFYDPGIACHLLKIHDAQTLVSSPKRGNVFESFVIAEVIKHAYNHGKEPSTYFWLDHQGHELDCIIDQGQHIIGLEIKAGRTIQQDFFKNITHWNNALPTDQKVDNYIIYGANKDQISGYKNVLSWQLLSSIL